jgi:hypothetical protein
MEQLTGETAVLVEKKKKPVAVPLCPSQIPHKVARDRTRSSAAKGQRLSGPRHRLVKLPLQCAALAPTARHFLYGPFYIILSPVPMSVNSSSPFTFSKQNFVSTSNLTNYVSPP